jgi:hypothetical protein
VRQTEIRGWGGGEFKVKAMGRTSGHTEILGSKLIIQPQSLVEVERVESK